MDRVVLCKKEHSTSVKKCSTAGRPWHKFHAVKLVTIVLDTTDGATAAQKESRKSEKAVDSDPSELVRATVSLRSIATCTARHLLGLCIRR